MPKRRTPLGRTILTAPLALLLTLGLAACINPPISTGGGTGGSGNDTDVTTPDDASDDAEETEDENGGQNEWSTQSGCVVGVWLADNERIGAFFAANVPGSEVTMDTPTGSATVTYSDDGSFSVHYDNWSMQARSDDVTVTLTREGTDRGEYTARDDGTLTQNDTHMGSVVTVETPMGGVSVDGEPASATAQYTCDTSTLEVTIDGDTSLMHRQ